MLGGYRKLKIYDKLDCLSVLRYLAKEKYAEYRVFFFNEETAISADYRPCYYCMREEYNKWKSGVK